MHCLKIFFMTTLLFMNMALSALNVESGFEISNIYRHDHYHRENSASLIHQEVNSIDEINVQNVDLWQLGINGRLMTPQNHFYWSNNPLLSLLNNFYIDGFAYWGWAGEGGQITENIHNLSTKNTSKSKAKLKKALTWDIQFGLGYLFNWDCWGLGISYGYSYNTQLIKPKHGKISVAPSPSPLEAQIHTAPFHTKTLWKGPWIGLELFYDWCNWKFDLGYEHHSALYTANHYPSLTNKQLGFEDKTHSSHAYGNVAFLDISYYFYEGWTAGTSFKYQNWKAKHGHLKPDDTTFALQGLPKSTKITAIGSWISYSISLDLGYSF